MKLSLAKKFGHVHVRAGEMVKVAQAHAVTTATRSASQEKWVRPVDERGWVYCEVGDLAIEIVAVVTGKLLGHAYLSGPAIQLHRYGPAQKGWFEPAVLRYAELPEPSPASGPEFAETFISKCMEYKYGKIDADVVAFRARALDRDDLERFGNFIQTAWSYAPHNAAGENLNLEPRAHMVCLAEADKGGVLVLHFQIPKHAADVCMTHFQAALVVAAAERGRDEAKARATGEDVSEN